MTVIATSFLAGGAALALLVVQAPIGVLLALVAVAGVGTSGTQSLLYAAWLPLPHTGYT